MAKAIEQVFVDTSAFKALVDAADDFHAAAHNTLNNLRREGVQLFTSNFIIDETATLVRARCGFAKASQLRDILAAGLPAITVQRTEPQDEVDAWDWFDCDWSGLSFTDCVCFAQMERVGIRRCFTFDKHFARAGFEIIGG